jgi:RND family efflux transporter MFP subunit
MTGRQMQTLVRLIHKVAGARSLGSETDDRLLERFVAGRDDNAFRALVDRHGPMVLGVCGRILRDANDVEDAFQATFLVLVRKAGSIGRPQLLANWLHGVARRTALEARTRAQRRRMREQQRVETATGEPKGAAFAADVKPALDEEIGWLPERYRVPVILCYLEGRTNEEAARIIGCPKGTVLSRLASARQRLRVRLTRRGLAPTVGMTAALASASLRAAVPAALARRLVETAILGGGASLSAPLGAEVISLANGVLNAMFWTKATYVVAILLSLVLVGGGLVLWAPAVNSAGPPEARKVSTAAVQEKDEAKTKAAQPAAGQGADSKAGISEVFTGRTVPLESVQLRSRVTGYLTKVVVKDGAEIKRGDLLFEIDPRPYMAEVDKAEAILAQRVARLGQIEADLKRLTHLQKANAVSQEELNKVQADRTDAQAQVRAAQAVRESARLQLEFTRITAPITGAFGGRLLDAGNLVRADETVLATLTSCDPMAVTFDVDERTVLRLRRAMAKTKAGPTLNVAMGLADEKDFPHRGRMEPIDFRVDPNTGTVRMRAIFPNSDHFLVPGLFCRVRLVMGESD